MLLSVHSAWLFASHSVSKQRGCLPNVLSVNSVAVSNLVLSACSVIKQRGCLPHVLSVNSVAVCFMFYHHTAWLLLHVLSIPSVAVCLMFGQ